MANTTLKQLMEREMSRKEFLGWTAVVVASIFGLGGIAKMLVSHAATPAVSLESEKGTLTDPAKAITDSSASGAQAVQFATPAAPQSIYRPYKITSATQLPHAPKDANYVVYTASMGAMLHQAFQKLGANDILVLPERAQPYEIDSSAGFASDGTRSIAMARTKRGLVGLGPGVIVQTSASSFSLPKSTSTAGNLNVVLQCVTAGAYIGNFEMRGRDFGQAAYDGIKMLGNNSVFERIFANGAHRGWSHAPPGEAGAFTSNGGDSVQIYNCEADCRDPGTGRPVGASPFMFNNQSNVRVDDFYGHHALTGMPTFWNTNNITTNRLRSEYNGTGPGLLTGYGLNHEQVNGTVTHNDPIILTGYTPTGNNGYHMTIGTNKFNAVYNINRPIFDAGRAGATVFDIGLASNNYQPFTQTTANIHVTGATARFYG
jgi:hypothetical protein